MPHDNPQNEGYVLKVEDVIETPRGTKVVAAIILTPTPSTDAAGEIDGVRVAAVELAKVPCVVEYSDPDDLSRCEGWLYGSQVTARRVTMEAAEGEGQR